MYSVRRTYGGQAGANIQADVPSEPKHMEVNLEQNIRTKISFFD